MVVIENLKPGMRVKIVDQWPGLVGQSTLGAMDCWLGKVVTISRIFRGNAFEIEEDRGVWLWFGEMVDYIVPDFADDFEPASESELIDMLLGR